jgi:hypothetical protein
MTGSSDGSPYGIAASCQSAAHHSAPRARFHHTAAADLPSAIAAPDIAAAAPNRPTIFTKSTDHI